jgi:hypothetical protein
VRQVDIKLPALFFILLAPKDEIQAGIIEESTVGFYHDTFEGMDILAAQEKWFANQLQAFHCERMLAIVLARYIDIACVGKHAERRKEHLLTMAFGRGVANNRENRRKLRKAAEKQIKPNEGLITRFVDSFLIGKSPNFSVADLRRMVSDARAAGIAPGIGPYSDPH